MNHWADYNWIRSYKAADLEQKDPDFIHDEEVLTRSIPAKPALFRYFQCLVEFSVIVIFHVTRWLLVYELDII